MVRFDKTLEEQRVPEWASGYVDYKGLKKTLASMIASGSIQKFNENTVYSPISVATTEVVLAPPGPGELEFMAEVDAEIEKVNSFTLKLKEDLSNQVAAVRKQKEKWLRAGSPRAQAGQLITTVDAAAAAMQRFEDYVNLNYIAFSKILKKHDKLSTCPFRLPYLLKIQSQTFVRDKMSDIIKSLSDTRAAILSGEEAARTEEGGFDPNQAGGTAFVRKTTKYWVQTKDVLRVKMFILRNRPIYKFTPGASDADLVSSVYLDNERLEMYEGRLKKTNGALAIRIRWYGAEDAIRLVYVERKTHQEDWYGDGDASAKERFPLPAECVAPYLQGALSPAAVGDLLAMTNFKGDIAGAVKLAAEVQAVVLAKRLRPAVRTHYMRTAFQKDGDATVRCSLDTELCMALEPCEHYEWKRSAPLSSASQLTLFPHAVLEVKLQLASGAAMPSWVDELLRSGCLRDVPKFSKFVHGTAMLRGSVCRELPYWWSAEMQPLWVSSITKTKPLPMQVLGKASALAKARNEADDDDAGGWGEPGSREPSPNHSPLGSPNVRDRGESPLRLLLACRWDVLLGL